MRRAALVSLLVLAGCATRQPAPVVERAPPPAVVSPAPPAAEPGAPAPAGEAVPTHTVKRGETLVGIALQYGLDYRELAAWNNIVNVNVIGVGQVLVLAAPREAAPPPVAAAEEPLAAPLATPLAGLAPIEARPLANSATVKVEPRGQKLPFSERALAQLGAADPGGPVVATAPPVAPAPAPPQAAPERPAGTDREDVDWTWPAKGRVIAPFTEASKGMDIAGRKGSPVVAAAGGRVVYAGAGLRGYGKLVIIKHSDTWLSAYAHNDSIVVKEQQDVRKGQKIAEMGSTDADQVKLHFEVRRKGKPVDPARVLPAM